MARKPRNVLPPAGAYHVTSRGVARQTIYRDADDYGYFTQLLRRAVRRFSWRLQVFCLMPNHFHLIVLTELERLSSGMHLLNFRYAQGFNNRYSRVGHLFQGRFHAKVIETDEHFETACAYVLDNPVRARLCERR